MLKRDRIERAMINIGTNCYASLVFFVGEKVVSFSYKIVGDEKNICRVTSIFVVDEDGKTKEITLDNMCVDLNTSNVSAPTLMRPAYLTELKNVANRNVEWSEMKALISKGDFSQVLSVYEVVKDYIMNI